VDIPIDTTVLADGEHDLKVVVTDAAGDSSTVLDQTTTTQNSTTVSSLLPSPPAASAAPIYSLSLTAATERMTRGVRRLYSRSALRLAGTLKDSSGVAAPGVPVSLWAQPASGSNFSEVAHTTTNATGAWTLTAPHGSSRLLTSRRWREGSGCERGPVRERARDRHTRAVATVSAPGGGRIVFTGQLSIAPLGQPRRWCSSRPAAPTGGKSSAPPSASAPTAASATPTEAHR